jgi:hypothetical protein
MRYTCPVCAYAKLLYPPRDYHICPCCSTEFGNDDAEFTHAQLREMWIAGDARWFFGNPPPYWNPWMQLIAAGLGESVPRFAFAVATSTSYATSLRIKRPTEQFVLSAA